jgi:hypothetical protein
MLPRDHFFFPDIHTSQQQVSSAVISRKNLPRTSLHCCLIFLILQIVKSNILNFENLIPLKPVLIGMRDVARFHYPSCTDFIKPCLQLSCNFPVINASKGSLFSQISIHHNSMCQVLFGSCKNLPCTSLLCCLIFLVLRDHWVQNF